MGLAPMAGGTGAAVTVRVTETETVVAPGALIEIIPLKGGPAASVPVATVRVTAAFPVPDTRESVNHGALVTLADQLRVPPPVLLIVRACVAGLPPPCWAVKERLVGLAPMAGLTETTEAEGGVINCASPGNSAASLLIDRPPLLPLPEVEVLPAPTAANELVPVDAIPAAMDVLAVAGDGATFMVARGTAAPTLLLL